MKRRLFALCALVIAMSGAGYLVQDLMRPSPRPGVPLPPPIENRQDRAAEQRHKQERRQWLAEMHRTAPDQDWRDIEAANGLAAQQRRNEQAASKVRSDRWTEVGSRNQAGRMHVAAVSVLEDSLYGGSSRGGVWKGSLSGEAWRPLSDNLWGGSHGLTVAGDQGQVITSVTDGGEVRYSEDGGATWLVPGGLPSYISACKRVARDAANANRVYLMVRVGTPSRLFRSDDGGRNYSLVLNLSRSTGDFWLDRVVGGDVYVMDGSDLRKSSNQGMTWTNIGSLPFSVNNVVLTASEAGAPTFYAAGRTSSGWRLYRSVNAGVDWTQRYTITDFWETLCASITDPDLIAFAGVELWRSTDGGDRFDKVNDWWAYYDDPVNQLHADFPGLDCIWIDGAEVWYAATDGGLYRSDDGLATVTNISLEGLGVSQYYGTLTSVNDPDLILAGAQDQGYQRSTGPGRGPGYPFEQLISGDYGHLTSYDGSHSTVFSVYPGFVLVQRGELNPTLAGYPDFPAGESYSWLPFIQADPEDEFAFFFCAKHLVRGEWNGGNNVTYTPSLQDFTTAGGSYLTCLGIAPSNIGYRIAAVDNGRIWYSSDGGRTWNLSSDYGPSAHYFYGTSVVHSPSNPLQAWLGGSGYAGSPVYRTDDGGETWVADGVGLPSTLVYGLAIESPENEVLYASTEAGPFRLDPTSGRWEDIGNGEAPLTTYWSIEAVPAAQVVRFGTYGRGIWDYSTESISATESLPATATLNLRGSPNPFNPRTTLSFRLDQATHVRLSIVDVAGRRVVELIDETRPAGHNEVVWNGRDQSGRECASGVFLLRLEAGDRVETGRVVLTR